MDLSNLTKLLGKPIILHRRQVFTDNVDIIECIQGILREIKAHSICIEQCFTDHDYMDAGLPYTARELAEKEFVLAGPVVSTIVPN